MHQKFAKIMVSKKVFFIDKKVGRVEAVAPWQK